MFSICTSTSQWQLTWCSSTTYSVRYIKTGQHVLASRHAVIAPNGPRPHAFNLRDLHTFVTGKCYKNAHRAILADDNATANVFFHYWESRKGYISTKLRDGSRSRMGQIGLGQMKPPSNWGMSGTRRITILLLCHYSNSRNFFQSFIVGGEKVFD